MFLKLKDSRKICVTRQLTYSSLRVNVENKLSFKINLSKYCIMLRKWFQKLFTNYSKVIFDIFPTGSYLLNWIFLCMNNHFIVNTFILNTFTLFFFGGGGFSFHEQLSLLLIHNLRVTVSCTKFYLIKLCSFVYIRH